LDIGQGEFINVSMGGAFKESWKNEYSYALKGDAGCVEISQTNFSFYAIARKNGKCVIEIANKNIQYSREALIVVRDEVYVPPDEYYITTSQNVIQMEIGQKFPTELNIQLINGNNADKASFEWTVDDGRVIDVDAKDLPLGKGVRYEQRSIRNLEQAEIKNVANTLALITPKKIGMAKIVVSHPKSESAATVICKVYPRGTFANQPFILDADEPKGGLIKVDTTKPDTLVKLKMASGDINDVGDLDWKIENTALAGLQDMKRLENHIHGIKKGVTKLIVDNKNLKNPYEATVMVGTTEELVLMPVLYVDQVYQTVAVGQSISVPVKNSADDINLTNSDRYTIGMYDKTKFAAVMIKNRLLLQGLEATAVPICITIGNTSGNEIASTQVIVTVVPGETTISHPYTITGPDFIGMNYNAEKDVKVVLTDAIPVEKDKVTWSSVNSAVVKVTGNGENARIKAGNTESQTIITASHSKSINEKMIVAYVVPPDVDPESVVVLGIEKDHLLIKTGDELVLQVITNAADREIKDITWGGNDISVATVDYNGSRALVRAVKAGSTVITVKHPKNLIELKIYISVSDMPSLAKQITLPGIVEMIIGENKVVTAATQGLSDAEVKSITWSVDDAKVIGISGEGPDLSGGKVFLQGREKGQAWLTARQENFGYQKKILVVCAKSYEELMSTYVMAGPESYYRLKVGESRDIQMIFGSAGFPEDKKQGIKWTDEGNKVVKIYDGGGGDHAKIEAVALGITTVTVNHKDVIKPAEITFETYTDLAAGTDYKFNSNTLMMGLVVKKAGEAENGDNTKVLTTSIYPPGLSLASLTGVDEDPSKGIYAFSRVSGNFRITAAAKGQSYLKISHPQVTEDLRVLIYAADSKDELDKLFPIALSKPNYLLTIGDPVSQYIEITTPPDTSAGYADKIKKISWGVDNPRVVDYQVSGDKKKVKIDGRNAGNCVFDIKYDNTLVEKAYVSVRSVAADMGKKIMTESIIGMTPGQKDRKTTIGSNLTDAEKKDLKWRTTDSKVVSIKAADNDFASQYLTAVSAGEAEVIVSFGQIERYIKVYVTADADNYRAVNLDNRYYQLRKNEEMTISAFHAALPCSSDDEWTFTPLDGKVVEIRPDGKDKLIVKGINEGIAAIILGNRDKAAGGTPMTDVQFMVEVNNTAPKIEDFTDDWYMTAFKTVYALDPAKTQDWLRITINGVRFPGEQLTQIKWRVKSEVIDGEKKELAENETSALIDMHPANGAFVEVAPKNRVGTVILEASHPRSVNKSLEITVICNSAMLLSNPYPHIVSDREVVKLQKYESVNFPVRIDDLQDSYDPGGFTVTSDNPSKVTAQVTGGQVTVKGVDFGQALITIAHPSVKDMTKKIVVMVMPAGDLIYLTTRQNFVVLEKGDYQQVEVDLVGFTDINNRNFIWNTDDWDLININDSGKQAVITARNTAKTAKITVIHTACPEYPLYIYVRVTDKLSAKPVYITTGNNIVAVKEGGSMQIKSNLVNGGVHELPQFQWSTGDKDLIELNYSSDTAIIKGIKAGTAQVSVWHPSSLNSINVIVVVEPNEPSNGIYITTDSLLVEMATTDKQRLIRARLVGGNNEDIYGFQWSVTQYQSVMRKGDGTSFQVVDMNANADMCFIYPHGEGGVYFEGDAVLTIRHPKTSYKVDVRIVVTDGTDIEFEKAYVTINQFAQETITVNASSSGKLSYTSTNNRIVTAEGTNKLCVINGLEAGTAIIIASNMSGTKSAELIVRVNAVDLNNYYYLETNHNIETINTQDSFKTIEGVVKDAKTGIKNEMLTGKLKWKIKESDRAKGVVRLNNSTDPAVVVTHNNVTLYPQKAGDIEIIFGFFDPADSLFTQYPTLKHNCAGKTIYVRVEQASSQFVLSSSVISMSEADSPVDAWARIDGVNPPPKYDDWTKGGDIFWRSDKPEVVQVVYNDKLMDRCNVKLEPKSPGSAQIYVTYDNSQQVIAVVVNPNSFVKSSESSFSVMPDISHTFVVTSNPKDRNITLMIDSNQWVKIESRPVRKKGKEEKWEAVPQNFKTQNGDQLAESTSTNVIEGYEFRVTGGVAEGVTTMMFEMRDTGKKMNVIITNVKGYFINWVGKSQMRFRPNETKQDVLRLEYTIVPFYDELEGKDEKEFQIVPGKQVKIINGEKQYDEDGHEIIEKRWIDFIQPHKEQSNELQRYFGTCGKTVKLFSRINKVSVDLDVFIYHETIPIEWKRGEVEYILASQAKLTPNGKISSFDAVNYSAIIGDYEKLAIDMIISDDYAGHQIIVKKPDNYNNGMINYNDRNNLGIYIDYRSGAAINNLETTSGGNVIKNVVYLTTLKLEYSYYNGLFGRSVFYKNILIYGADVIRTTQ
jgi:ribosomal protein S6E (S10)